ncbi:MAG: hypothetical protein Q8P67_21300, partial [archaeon]|nr:hypothetical protein [archaeon]
MASISSAVGQRGFLFVPIPSLPSGICDTPSSLESLKEPLADALVLQILPAGLMAVIDRATRMVGEALYLQLVWALPVDHLSPFSRLLVVEGLLRVLYASFPRLMDGPSVALVIFPPDLVGDYLPIQN